MKRFLKFLGISFAIVIGLLAVLGVAGWIYFHPTLARHEKGIVYGQRDSAELTLELVQPANPNRAAVVVVVSGSWKSNPGDFRVWGVAPLIRKGFTVFAVSHISQPSVTIMEIEADLERAIRFIRTHAEDYGIDPGAIGIAGGSSGGHLSLCAATMGDPGDPTATDPVEMMSSQVQAAAVFFPVTDLLNLGESTENPGDGGPPIHYVRGFGPNAADLEKWPDIGRSISPIYHVGKDVPPVLIFHGDADSLVPLDQSTRFKEAVEAVGGGPIELHIREGGGHGYPGMIVDLFRIANFFSDRL